MSPQQQREYLEEAIKALSTEPADCGQCRNPSVFRPDDDAPFTFVCDTCGSVTEDNGKTWTPSIFDNIMRSLIDKDTP